MEADRETEIERILPKAESAARYQAARARLNADDAEDLVQIALVEVLRGWDRWDPAKSTWSTYAVNCARWGAKRELRRRAKKKKAANAEFLDDSHADPNADDPVQNAEKEEARKILDKYLTRYPPRSNYVQAVRLVYFDGLNYSETARRLGISANRVGQICRKTKNEIRNQIDQPD